METRWLEDIVSLADTRSFRRSAQLRHVTQPAFSRRIRALETWAGTELVDRSSYPMRMTPAGKTLCERAVDLLTSLRSTQAQVRGLSSAGQGTVTFAAPAVLASTCLSRWLASWPRDFPSLRTSIATTPAREAMALLVERKCDVMVAYHHDSAPLPFDGDRYETIVLGAESLHPYARPDAQGKPRHRLPGKPSAALPYLAYKPGAYLGEVMECFLGQIQPVIHLDRVFEADMAECLKAMALEGHGIAFLPQSAVVQELRALKLVEASDPANPLSVPLSIRAYRERPPTQRRRAVMADTVWNWLTSRVAVSAGQ